MADNGMNDQPTRQRRGTTVTSLVQAAQNAGTAILNTDLPPGFFAASAVAGSNAPSIAEVRRRGTSQSAGSDSTVSPVTGSGRAPWISRSGSSNDQKKRQKTSRSGSGTILEQTQEHGEPQVTHGLFSALTEEPSHVDGLDRNILVAEPEEIAAPFADAPKRKGTTETAALEKAITNGSAPAENHTPSRPDRAHTSGFVPPMRLPWYTTTGLFLKTFWKWFITPTGFLVTVYFLNVVAWGGMLFLLLCNASPAMCSPNTPETHFDGCNYIGSPRRIWIEIDSQILNALFCVTGFGLFPWRARDLYYLLRWRLASRKVSLQEQLYGLRVLAGIHRGWVRLPGCHTMGEISAAEYAQSLEPTTSPISSSEDDSDVRIPLHRHLRQHDLDGEKRLLVEPSPLSPPLTGVRAPPTPLWKLDFFVWMQIMNTVFQCCLCGFMWGFNRHTRPSWSTGLFIALAFGVAAAGGLVSFMEGRKVKRVEGTEPREDEIRAMEKRIQKKNQNQNDPEARLEEGTRNLELAQTNTERESVHIGEKAKDDDPKS